VALPIWVDAAAQTVAACGGVGGFVAAFLYRYQRRKLNVDTERARVDSAQVLSESALALLEPYRRQIVDLEHDLDKARSQVRDLTGHLESAQAELQHLRNQVSVMSKELDSR
jgi:predicted  nucleic acid-binding Zn-ribbon protein